jgi:hypothetical protein
MQASGHGWISPMTSTTNYPVDNSLAILFPFPNRDENEDVSMNGKYNAWKNVREVNGCT